MLVVVWPMEPRDQPRQLWILDLLVSTLFESGECGSQQDWHDWIQLAEE